MDLTTLALVGGAVAGPTVLRALPRAGIAIPAYVTAGQKAAMAELARPIAGVAQGASAQTQQATQRYHEIKSALTTQANCSDACAAFVAAARAGAFVDVSNPFSVEAYAPTESWAVTAQFRDSIWEALAQSDGTALTSFGAAVAQVMQRQAGLADGFLSSPEDFASVRDAVGILAVEMDNLGYLITGKPEEKTLAGGFQAAGDAVVAFGGHVAAGAGRAALGALWEALNALPAYAVIALGAGGYLVVRRVL